MLCRAAAPCSCGRPFALLGGIGGRAIEAGLVARLRSDFMRQGGVPPPIAFEFVAALERNAERMGKRRVVGHRGAPSATEAVP